MECILVSAGGFRFSRAIDGWGQLGGGGSGGVCGRLTTFDDCATGKESEGCETKEAYDDGFHGEWGAGCLFG